MYKNNHKVRNEIMGLILSDTEYFNFLTDLLPHVKNGDEILDVLFTVIKEGFGLEKKIIISFLDGAVKKGVSKADNDKYYEASKGVGGELADWEEESYNDSMNVVKKYLKDIKTGKIDKKDKFAVIIEKLQKNKYSDKVYDKILKLL